MSHRIRFSPDTKAHDGLCKTSECFANYMNDILRPSKDPRKGSSIKVPFDKLDIRTLTYYRKMLVDLMDRCYTSGKAPILPQGGHSGVIKLADIPYLQQCLSHMDNVISIVMAKLEENAITSLVNLSKSKYFV